jgi:hypothetical protein
MTRIELEDGKYTALYDNGILIALRYGEPWRDMTGDKFTAALVDRIDQLETKIEADRAAMRLALDALLDIPLDKRNPEQNSAITALRGRLGEKT